MPYKSAGAKKVIQYIKTKYGAGPEFLWARSPNTSIFRNRRNNKWYAALIVIPKDKLGIPGAGDIEILNLKLDPGLITTIIDRKSFFPGWHMNKGHWVTVLLDDSVQDKDLCALIDLSYKITDSR
jgi:predicted DNA-binding protein (MmcQ/YjbR family)